MNPAEPNDELFQPLVDAVTEGRTTPEAELLALEHAAAVLHGAYAANDAEPPPKALMRRLQGDIDRFARPAREPATVSPVSFVDYWLARLGWLAAAVCLALALFLWNTRPLNPPATRAQAAASLEAQRAELLTATDLIRLALRPGGAEEGTASAELLWSTARQTGFLDLRQVRPNDPAREQYQIWIVDPLRDPVAPVDAGVFDVAPDGTGLVRFTPKLPIISPGAFAITREQSGGVVKSRAASPVLIASVR